MTTSESYNAMATSQTATNGVAKLAGLLPSTTFRIGRLLREAPGDLFPVGSSGRGREAHVHPHHLVNLMIGLAASPYTAAVDLVQTVRCLVPNMQPYSAPFIRGDTFAAALENRIDDIASDNHPPGTYQNLSVTIYRVGTFLTYASLEESLYLDGSNLTTRQCVYAAPSDQQPLTELSTNIAGAPQYTFKVDQRFIHFLAVLWADTKRRLPSPQICKTEEEQVS